MFSSFKLIIRLWNTVWFRFKRVISSSLSSGGETSDPVSKEELIREYKKTMRPGPPSQWLELLKNNPNLPWIESARIEKFRGGKDVESAGQSEASYPGHDLKSTHVMAGRRIKSIKNVPKHVFGSAKGTDSNRRKTDIMPAVEEKKGKKVDKRQTQRTFTKTTLSMERGKPTQSGYHVVRHISDDLKAKQNKKTHVQTKQPEKGQIDRSESGFAVQPHYVDSRRKMKEPISDATISPIVADSDTVVNNRFSTERVEKRTSENRIERPLWEAEMRGDSRYAEDTFESNYADVSGNRMSTVPDQEFLFAQEKKQGESGRPKDQFHSRVLDEDIDSWPELPENAFGYGRGFRGRMLENREEKLTREQAGEGWSVSRLY